MKNTGCFPKKDFIFVFLMDFVYKIWCKPQKMNSL